MTQDGYGHDARGFGAAAAAEDPQVLAAIDATLARGGNAVDAAVAGAAAQGVCRPMSGGLGGGGFMLIHLPTGRTVAIEHREQAAAAFGPQSLMADGVVLPGAERSVHAASVGVPGALRAWDEALRLHGRLGLAAVLEPAIALAEQGFEVDQTLHREIAVRRDDFALYESTAELYLDAAGQAPAVGTTLRNPDLARTYREIAAQGIDDFYHGRLAGLIVDAVNDPPAARTATRTVRRGHLTRTDLAQYQVRHLEPIRYRYAGYEIAGPPLPSSGAITIGEALGVLDRQPAAAADLTEHLHRYLSACRTAFADREAYLGDARLVDVPAAALLSDEYLDLRTSELATAQPSSPHAAGSVRAAVPGDVRSVGAPWMTWEPESPSTIHLSVADEHGCAVSHTSTIVSMGGCGIVVPGTGILLNDALAGRTANNGGPFGAGRPMGGMRPLSSMAPTMVFRDGALVQTVGSPGGSTIITTVLQILYLSLGVGMCLSEALAFPRATQNSSNAPAEAEPAFLALDLVDDLRSRGNDFTEWTAPEGIGAANGLRWSADGSVTAVAEPVRRGSGYAAVWPGRSGSAR